MSTSVSATDKLSFVPSKSVTFMPNGSKQMAEMTITNESDKSVMFKMKSTRPGMFKMRPVYGATTVRLIFKGLKPGQEAPRKERFTIVAAIAPSACVDTEKIWKSHKYQEKLIESELGKKRFKILFFGINDQEEDDEDEKAEEKKKKGISEGDPDGEDKAKATGAVQKEKIVENIIIKKEVVQAPPKKLVMVMYRDQKHDSLSGDDDDDDADATVVTQPGQKPGQAGQKPPSTSGPPIKLAQPPSNTAKSTQTQPPKSAPPATAPKSAPPPPPPKGPNALTATQQKQLAAVDDDLAGAKTCRINKNFEQRPAAPVAGK
ncbi:MSP domain protein [Cooperia oncophora]